jgi:hypothetical protein
MGFLDNSGDIILDAVLTDSGRKRLAKGDGTFKVTKYAFGDDEINYTNYNAANISGSAYYDIEILQTPILEAFTNNRSSLKSKLITLTNNNLLFLPVVVLNENADATRRPISTALAIDTFVVVTDSDTKKILTGATQYNQSPGMIDGTILSKALNTNYIRVDQGLNTTKLSPVEQLSAELREEQYLIQIDNRLGSIYDAMDAQAGSPAFIDDDQIASYYVTRNVGAYIDLCATGDLPLTGDPDTSGRGASPYFEVLPGPRGTKLMFSILASDNLKASTYLFQTMGTSKSFTIGATTSTYFVIDTTIKITGITTGYVIDIPVRFVKLDD